MRGKPKAILRHISMLVLGVLLGVNVYSIYSHSVLGNPLPMPFGIGAATVQSGSMETAYSIGDLLLVKARDGYRVGDVVVYRSGTMPVVHRIIAIDGSTVTTQGDANNAPDEPFDVSCILGTVVGCVPGAGIAIDFLKTPPGILLPVGLAVLLMGLSFRREKAAEQENKARQIRQLREEIDRLRQEPIGGEPPERS